MQYDYEERIFLLVDGMDENLIAGEDFDFCQRIRKLNKQVFLTSTRLFIIMIEI